MRLSTLSTTQRGVLLCTLALLGVFAVFADNTAFAAVTTSSTTEPVLVKLYEDFFKPFATFKERLAPSGMILLWSLLVLHVAFGGVQVASGTIDLFELAMQGVKLSIVGALIMSAMAPQAFLGSMTGIGGAITLPEAIIHGMRMLAAHAVASIPKGAQMFGDITGSGGSDIASSAMFGAIFRVMFEGLRAFLDVPIWPENSSGSTTWIGALLSMGSELLSVVFAFIFWAGSIFMYLLACGMVILELFGAVLTTAVALAFTPLMVPWLLFRPLQFLFDSWLRGILIGSLGFVIGVLMLAGFVSFVDGATAAIKAVPSSEYQAGPKVALVFLPLFLGSFLFTMLATKINGLASGLISGSGTDGISAKSFALQVKGASTVAGGAIGSARVAAGAAASAGRAGAGVLRSASSGVGAAASVTKQASAAAGGGIKGAWAGGAAGVKSMAAGVKSKANAGVNSIAAKSKAAAASLGESPGMTAAKNVAAQKGVAPSKEQMNKAASAASSAIRTARFQGKMGTDVDAAGQAAAKTALTGVVKAPKAVSAPSGTGGGQSPAFQPSPGTPSAPFPKIPKP